MALAWLAGWLKASLIGDELEALWSKMPSLICINVVASTSNLSINVRVPSFIIIVIIRTIISAIISATTTKVGPTTTQQVRLSLLIAC